MPFELPNLDDRRFDDLVSELRARLASHTPEWKNLVPGDPAVAFIDLFAFLTESICYRANLIPERQRRAFLNLLHLPLRPARPARGLVCVDARAKSALLPPIVPAGSLLTAGKVAFSTLAEVQPTPLALHVLVKKPVLERELADAGISPDDLAALHRTRVSPFRPWLVAFPQQTLNLGDALDKALHLALCVPPALAKDVSAAELRSALLGKTLSIALSPALDAFADEAQSNVVARRLIVDAAYQSASGVRHVPLTEVADSSQGARRPGVLRVRLPSALEFLQPPEQPDPQYAGVGDAPPELITPDGEATLVCWLRLACPSDPQIVFDYVAINGVDVVAQEWVRERRIAVGDGNPEQVVELGHGAIDEGSFGLEVQAGRGASGDAAGWERWSRVEHLAAATRHSKVYVLDAEAGTIRFGDGIRGVRPPSGQRIRASYRHGGGVAGNLGPKSITALASGDARYAVRHELAARGGTDTESVVDAERRIAGFLRHRERAVTIEDFRALALDNPIRPVARAEVVPGLVPEATPSLARRGVPGALSIFVLPPPEAAVAGAPRASVGLLADVHAYLRERVLIGTELYVLSPAWTPLAVTVCCAVRDSEREQETLRAVERAILEYLWALPPGGPRGEGWPLGYDVDASELLAVAARVPNVLKVGSVALYTLEASRWRRIEPGREQVVGDFALPELLGVMALGDPTAEPALPASLAPRSDGPQPVPAPVIPDRC
jgi:hypothetical protein